MVDSKPGEKGAKEMCRYDGGWDLKRNEMKNSSASRQCVPPLPSNPANSDVPARLTNNSQYNILQEVQRLTFAIQTFRKMCTATNHESVSWKPKKSYVAKKKHSDLPIHPAQ